LIAGILQAVEENKKRTNEVVEEAFTDLKQLMSRAADMVSLADRITKKLEKEGTAEENTLMKSYLLELGISSPVTRYEIIELFLFLCLIYCNLFFSKKKRNFRKCIPSRVIKTIM